MSARMWMQSFIALRCVLRNPRTLRELIRTTTRTTRVAFWDPPSGSKNILQTCQNSGWSATAWQRAQGEASQAPRTRRRSRRRRVGSDWRGVLSHSSSMYTTKIILLLSSTSFNWHGTEQGRPNIEQDRLRFQQLAQTRAGGESLELHRYHCVKGSQTRKKQQTIISPKLHMSIFCLTLAGKHSV